MNKHKIRDNKERKVTRIMKKKIKINKKKIIKIKSKEKKERMVVIPSWR